MELKDFNEKVADFLSLEGMSQAKLSKSVGYNPAVLSQIKAGTYRANNEEVIKKIISFIDHYNKKIQKDIWIETSQTKMVRIIISKAIAKEEMAVIYGESGSGKTTLTRPIATEELTNAAYVQCYDGMPTKRLLLELSEQLNFDLPKSTVDDMFHRLKNELLQRDVVIFVDESEYLNYSSIEKLRRLWDMTNTPVIMIGTKDLLRNISKHRQLRSRTKTGWHIEALKSDEVDRYIEETGKSFHPQAVENIKKLTKGNFRDTAFLINNALELAEITKEEVISQELVMNAKKMSLMGVIA